MADRHPRDMSLHELAALPTVNRIFSVEWSFVAANGQVWQVGRSGTVWVKTAAPRGPAVIARAADEARRRA